MKILSCKAGCKAASFVIAAFALALLASAANAQMADSGGGGLGGGKGRQQKAEKTDTQHAPKADEKAYAAALKTVPDKPFDPWHGVR
jgi:hypothetical protein